MSKQETEKSPEDELENLHTAMMETFDEERRLHVELDKFFKNSPDRLEAERVVMKEIVPAIDAVREKRNELMNRYEEVSRREEEARRREEEEWQRSMDEIEKDLELE